MRQKSSASYTTVATRAPRREQTSTHYATTRFSQPSPRRRREPTGITITPVRGFFMALLFLGVPTVSLGSLCFSLLQNNVRLNEENNELTQIATEVKRDIDSLGAEIDSLRERAGVPKDVKAGNESVSAVSKGESANSAQRGTSKGVNGITTDNASLIPSGIDSLASNFPHKGGPSQAASPLDLLEGAKAEVPKLNKALDSAIKPALEETLAEEAAHPDGQPVVGKVEISSGFGLRGNPFGGGSYEMHEGIDFVGEHGDIIAATGDGVVTLAGYNGGYGISVTIEHGNGYETLYAHMSETKMKVGNTVKRGQIIGYIGSTGRSSGPHLHYSIYKNDVAIDPAKLMVFPKEEKLADGPR